MRDTVVIWNTMCWRLPASFRSFFLVHLACTVFGLAVLAPLTGLTVRTLLALGGKTAVADQDIAWFLLSPLGMASLVLVAGLVLALAAVEQAAMLAIAAEATAGRSAHWFAALKFAFSGSGRVLSFAVRLVLRVLAIVLPFVAVAAAVAWLLITDYDINFYLSQRPPEFLLTAAIAAVLLLAMLALLLARLTGWVIALPLLLFSDTAPAATFAESERLTHGRRWWIARVLLGWAAMTLALGAIVAVPVELLGAWLVPRSFDSLRWLVSTLGLLVVVGAVGSLLASALAGGAFSLALMEFYTRLVAESGNPLGAKILDLRGAASRNPWRMVTLLAGISITAIGIGAWLMTSAQAPDAAVVVAHRGAAGRAPENTLASIRAAVADGTDWVEIDVQETVDGEVVVVHDSDFMKLAGVSLKVWNGTLSQVQDVDVGGWFGPSFAGERVPTLQAVLEEIKSSHAQLVIELKYYGHDQDLERRVIDLVERNGMADRVAIMSLKYPGIQKVRTLRPDWNTGLLAATAVGNLARLDADFLAVNTGMAKPRFIRQAHAAGKKVLVWTVNDPVSMSRMLSLGVDGIITDEPSMARQVIRERAEFSSVERLLVHAAAIFGTPSPPREYRDDSP